MYQTSKRERDRWYVTAVRHINVRGFNTMRMNMAALQWKMFLLLCEVKKRRRKLGHLLAADDNFRQNETIKTILWIYKTATTAEEVRGNCVWIVETRNGCQT